MPYRPEAIANYFLEKSFFEGELLSPMKLIKMTYIAHGWHLAIRDEPLLSEPIQAWKYGPVIPSLYHQLKDYGSADILQSIPTPMAPPWTLDDADHETKEILEAVWQGYKGFSGLELSTLTHQQSSAWHKVWEEQGGKHQKHAVIPNRIIQEHFQTLLDDTPAKAQQY